MLMTGDGDKVTTTASTDVSTRINFLDDGRTWATFVKDIAE